YGCHIAIVLEHGPDAIHQTQHVAHRMGREHIDVWTRLLERVTDFHDSSTSKLASFSQSSTKSDTVALLHWLTDFIATKSFVKSSTLCVIFFSPKDWRLNKCRILQRGLCKPSIQSKEPLGVSSFADDFIHKIDRIVI
ncbi:MAG: hypothetical protein AAF629_11890, partial [Chloroflexota bacterium]